MNLQYLIFAECLTAVVTTCRFLGWVRSALWMAVLLLSVPQLVKTISRGSAPIRAATFSRAKSTALIRSCPKEYALEGFPHFSVKYGSIASITSGATRVVALLSK